MRFGYIGEEFLLGSFSEVDITTLNVKNALDRVTRLLQDGRLELDDTVALREYLAKFSPMRLPRDNEGGDNIPTLSENALFLLSELRDRPAFLTCHSFLWKHGWIDMMAILPMGLSIKSEANELIFEAPDSETRPLLDAAFDHLKGKKLLVELTQSLPDVVSLESEQAGPLPYFFGISEKGLRTLQHYAADVAKIKKEGTSLVLKAKSFDEALQAMPEHYTMDFETLNRACRLMVWRPEETQAAPTVENSAPTTSSP